jgi:predicted transcriptional regulator
MLDKFKKKRHAFGERNSQAKLSLKSVNEIRASNHPVSTLAVNYGVTEKTIQNILRGKTWSLKNTRPQMGFVFS